MGSCGASRIEDRQGRVGERAEGQVEGLKPKAAGLNSFRPRVSRVGAGHREEDRRRGVSARNMKLRTPLVAQ